MDKEKVIISGPPCSGKTYLLNNSQFIKKVSNNEAAIILSANEVRNSPNKIQKPSVLVHYDCFRNFKRRVTYENHCDVFLKELIKHAKEFKVILIVNSLPTIIQRLNERMDRLRPLISPERLDKLTRLKNLYHNSERFINEYFLWYDFLDSNKLSPIYLYLNNESNVSELMPASKELLKSLLLVNHDS